MQYYEWWGQVDSIAVRFAERDFNGFWMVESRPVEGWDELSATYLEKEAPVLISVSRGMVGLFFP